MYCGMLTEVECLERRGSRGVLLAEALFSAILVATALGIMAASLTTWERASLKSKQRAGASLFAKQAMERCLAAGFDEVESLDTGGTPRILEVVRTIDGATSVSRYELNIEVSELPSERIKSVEVVVSYEQDSGSPVRLYSLVYQTS